MAKFTWRIDSENYLSNKSSHADKMKTRQFIEKICKVLDEYSEKYTFEQLKNNEIPHCHKCLDLRKNSSDAAKKLYKHFTAINEKLACKAIQIEDYDIYQFKIKGMSEKQGYRCFGYFLSSDPLNKNIFNLVYLDPDHEVYRE